jgi:hypothetical protein
MTRKDYILIANALFTAKPIWGGEPTPETVARLCQWLWSVKELTLALHDGHPEFQPERFRQACGVRPEDEAMERDYLSARRSQP